jgi:uncharacterized protein
VIILDTGPLLAAANDRDQHHAACAELLATARGPLLVPSSVVIETCWLLETRRGSQAEAAFLRSFNLGLELVELIADDLNRMAELVEQYASLPLGAVDASVIAVAERLV